MFILAVDTTTPDGSVALLDNHAVISEYCLASQQTHSARLFKAIDFVLDSAKLTIKDVDAFAVAAGPGSFTGIRIGLSAVKAFAFASGKPVAQVPVLEALAAKVLAENVRLACPFLDAKKSEIYAALFELKGRQIIELVPQGAYNPDDFFSRLPLGRVIHFSGNGLRVYREKVIQYLRDKARFPQRTFFIAAEVGKLGYKILEAGQGKSASQLEPIYLRKSQAEEKCQR